MSERLKELRDKQSKVVAEARERLDEINADTDESRAKELEEQFDRAMAEFDRIEAQVEREEKIAKREAAIREKEEELEEVDLRKRPGRGEKKARVEEDEPAVTARAAFTNFLRFGRDGLSPDERKALARLDNPEGRKLLGEVEGRAQAVGTAAAGGALVPEDFMAEIVQSMADWGPMNDDTIVRVVTTDGGADMPWPTVDDTSNKGALIAENTQVSTQDVTYSTKTLGAFKYTSKLVLVSNELLQDNAFDLDDHLQMLLAERIARIYNQHFTTGTGSSQPNGIVTASTQGVEAASATTLTADELIDLEHSVDPAYRRSPRCRFMFNDTTFKVIRKLKDGDSNYLWQAADIRVGAPASILGFPYSINQDMDSFGDSSPSTDNRPVVFGDFGKYVVRRVRAFAVRRLVERYADFDQVGFLGFTRADGELLDTAAIKHLYAAE